MSERNGFEHGVPCWIAGVHPDPEAAASFYGGLLGWEAEETLPAGAGGSYLVCRLRGREVAAIGSPPGGAANGAALWATHVWVNDADAAEAKVTSAGGSVLSEPFDLGPAGRTAVVAHPYGTGGAYVNFPDLKPSTESATIRSSPSGP